MKCEKCENELPGATVICKRCGYNNALHRVTPQRARPEQNGASRRIPASAQSVTRRVGDATLIQFPVTSEPMDDLSMARLETEAQPAWRRQVAERVRQTRQMRETGTVAVIEKPVEAPAENGVNPLVQRALNRIRRVPASSIELPEYDTLAMAPPPPAPAFVPRATTPAPVSTPAPPPPVSHGYSHGPGSVESARRNGTATNSPRKTAPAPEPAPAHVSNGRAPIRTEVISMAGVLSSSAPVRENGYRDHQRNGFAQETLPVESYPEEIITRNGASLKPHAEISYTGAEWADEQTEWNLAADANAATAGHDADVIARADATRIHHEEDAADEEEADEMTDDMEFPEESIAREMGQPFIEEYSGQSAESARAVWSAEELAASVLPRHSNGKAPLSARLAAFIIDLEIVAFSFLPFFAAWTFFEAEFSKAAAWSLIGVMMLMMFLYQALTLSLAGRTCGMALFRIRVSETDDHQHPPSVTRALRRAMGSVISLFCIPLNVLVIVLSPERQSLADQLSGTTIVRQ
ncbi:MAG: RDD family protein [Blastocatellia bacterium]